MRNQGMTIAAIAASLGISALIYLALIDNLEGFRKAEAISALLSALFTGLSFIWLIYTAISQKHELELQRKDIEIQAEQTALMAQELKNQVELSRLQIRSALMTQVSSQIYSILINNNKPYNKIYKDTIHNAEMIAQADIALDARIISIKYYQYGIKINYIHDGPRTKTKFLRFEKLPKVRIFEFHTRPILKSFQSGKEYGLEDWFLREMPLAFAKTDKIEQSAMFVSINMICLHYV